MTDRYAPKSAEQLQARLNEVVIEAADYRVAMASAYSILSDESTPADERITKAMSRMAPRVEAGKRK